tara:strand:- start:163868 stop:164191 length:324 start_codon:yes stop_codon:yes gene_type:complete
MLRLFPIQASTPLGKAAEVLPNRRERCRLFRSKKNSDFAGAPNAGKSTIWCRNVHDLATEPPHNLAAVQTNDLSAERASDLVTVGFCRLNSVNDQFPPAMKRPKLNA